MRHGFFGELAVGFVGVGDERDASGRETSDAVDLAPFGEVAGDYFFDVVGDVDPADFEKSRQPCLSVTNTDRVKTNIGGERMTYRRVSCSVA